MLERTNTTSERACAFGPFHLFADRRMLFEGDREVRLGSRALDILVVLVERAGELVSKRDLVGVVWPDTVVVDANLTVHVAALRRALGDGQSGGRYIVTSPGRGYRFVAPIRFVEEPTHAPPPAPSPAASHNLPAQLTRLIGRGSIVADLAKRLPTQRLLSLVGPPGIGKTALAFGLAEELLPAFEHGVWLIDLASVGDPSLVAATLASVLQVEIRSADLITCLLAALRDRRMLLVFDNCEHVIESAASLANAILKSARGVHVLATSREPLRVEGEHVFRLPPLESPPCANARSADEALTFSAVQLFADRAAASMGDFELSDDDATAAARICRELDGNPLAIEFAAARVDTFGVQGLAARLDDRLRLLADSHRGTQPRHRTIGAALDWSYQLLSEGEQAVFRRLAIFTGAFTLEAAYAVTVGVDGAPDIGGTLAVLVMKSLVAAEIGEGTVRFRLLEITRAFAMTKLIEHAETDTVARLHASHFAALIETRSGVVGEADLVGRFARDIDNLRSAINWAFSPTGDRPLAVALVAGSVPIWLEMSLLTECRAWAERALEIIDASDRGNHREMVLQAALGFAIMFAQGTTAAAREALTTANELAEGLRDRDWQLQTLVDLTFFCHRVGDNRGALALARRAETIVQGDANAVARATTDSITCGSLFYVGDYASAMTYGRRARREATPAVRRRQIKRWGLDYSIYAQCVIARAFMHQGFFEQATQTIREAVAEAEAWAHPATLCQALVWWCSIAVGLEDLDMAEILIARIRDQAERNGLHAYYSVTFASEGRVLAKRGNIDAGRQLLRAGIEKLRQASYETQYVPFLGHLAEALVASGFFEDGLAAADEALQRVQRNSALWWLPEALRVKGEVLLVSPCGTKAGEAEDHFRQSLGLAGRQHALTFELRSTVSLARFFASSGRVRDAHNVLKPVLSKFTEGFGFADIQRAQSLLQQLEGI